jgi:hypothetical protein
MRYIVLVIAVIALFGCADLVGKAVVQTGALNISSAPKGAGIYIDSVYKGVTPKYLSGIPVGSHAVKLKKSGYYDYTATKYVYAGKTTNMYASLKPNTGSINVKSYPSGARIIVDNAYKGDNLFCLCRKASCVIEYERLYDPLSERDCLCRKDLVCHSQPDKGCSG